MGHLLTLTLLLSTLSTETLPSYKVRIDGQTHKVLLTIDDHPNRTTPQFLALLQKCKLRATFFIIGHPEYYLKKYPKNRKLLRLHSYLKNLGRSHHELGNHGISHRDLCKLSIGLVRWELKGAQRLIKNATGRTLRYWRPPHTTRCRKSFRTAARMGLKVVMVDVSDYRSSGKRMYHKLLRRHRRYKKRTSIILFHHNLSKLKTFLQLSGLCTHF